MPYSKFSDSLYKMVIGWAGKWTRLANARLVSSPQEVPGGPKSLRGIISVHTKAGRLSAQKFTLTMFATGKGAHVAEYGHSEELAGAYEYGTGLNAQFEAPEGGRSTYKIKPRKGKYLVFPWDKANDSIPKFYDESEGKWKVILKSVNHPGVDAANNGKGYIRDSAQELLKSGVEVDAMVGTRAILDELNYAFKRGKK